MGCNDYANEIDCIGNDEENFMNASFDVAWFDDEKVNGEMLKYRSPITLSVRGRHRRGV